MKTYTPKKGTTIKYVTSDELKVNDEFGGAIVTLVNDRPEVLVYDNGVTEVRRYSDLGTTSVMVDETGALLTNFDRS